MESRMFKEYLTSGSLEGLASIPKSDLHNHASNGGNVAYIEKIANVKIEPPPPRFPSLTEMEKWAHANIKKHCAKKTRHEAAFVQARNDGVSVLALSVFRSEMEHYGTCGQFIQAFREFKDKHIPGALFLPEISYSGGADADEIDREYYLLDEILSYGYFASVDLCYDELAHPVKRYKDYKKIFMRAKKSGLKLKAHAGEYGTADDVMRAVEELELDEVHHGIGAASSPQVMRWLARHKIQLNICPTSNVMLGRAESYKEHPIRVLYDYGIPVTVNTDDMLIFNQSVSQEYFNLHECGLMTADELDGIRKAGIAGFTAT